MRVSPNVMQPWRFHSVSLYWVIARNSTATFYRQLRPRWCVLKTFAYFYALNGESYLSSQGLLRFADSLEKSETQRDDNLPILSASLYLSWMQKLVDRRQVSDWSKPRTCRLADAERTHASRDWRGTVVHTCETLQKRCNTRLTTLWTTLFTSKSNCYVLLKPTKARYCWEATQFLHRNWLLKGWSTLLVGHK